MASIDRTAFPRLGKQLSRQELQNRTVLYTATGTRSGFTWVANLIRQAARNERPRLIALLLSR